MAWDDKPTKGQVNALWHMMEWSDIPTAELHDALHWMEENATRRQASDELGRVRDMKIEHHRLTRDEFFKGDIWRGYFDSKTK